MDEEIIFKVGVDTGNSVNDLSKVEKGLSDINQEAQSVGSDAAAKFDALNKKVASGTMTMRDAQKAVKEYQTIALQAGRESPIGQAAIQAAGELKDTIGDLRTEITNAGTDGAKMQAALQLGSGIAAGYGAVQGTMALMGVQSESLEKSLQKLMAVQSVLNGIEQIRSILEKESFLMMQARSAATTVMTAVQGVYTVAVGATTGAMAALRVAMLAIPLVAVIAGITALVYWFSKVEDDGKKVVDTFKKQGEAAEKYRKDLSKANEVQNSMTDKTLKALDQEAARRKAMGEDAIKVQQEINDKKIKELEIAIEHDAADVRSLNAQKEKLKLLQDQAKEEILSLMRKEEAAAKDSWTTSQVIDHMKKIKDLAEQAKEVDRQSSTQMQEINKQLKDRITEIEAQKNAVIDLKTEQIDLNRQQGEKAAEAAKAAADERARVDFEKRRESINAEVADMQLKTKTLQTIEIEGMKSTDELRAEIDLEEKRNAEQREKEHQDNMVQLNKDARAAKLQIAYDTLDLIQNVTELFGRKNEKAAKVAFQIDKTAKIASATMSGIEGTINAFKTASSSPITEVFPAYPFIQAGLAGAFAATNIAKIAQTQFQSSGGAGSNVGAVPAPSTGAPAVPAPEATTTLTAGLPGGSKQGGNKVFVVDSEITQQQNKSHKIAALATFGG